MVVNQRPLRGALIAQPVVFHQSLRLSRAHKRRHGRFPWFRNPLSFDQKEFAFSKSEEWLPAFFVGALAEHVVHFFPRFGWSFGVVLNLD
jgi:hypothetical protein